jgi:hypothetical protein
MTLFWVGGTATWNSTAGTKWATSSGGAGGAAIPTAADDVFFDGPSGANTVTLSAQSVARSIDCNGFTGTISHPSAITISIGDATAGAGNRALRFVAGMTYTLGSGTTSQIAFASTSATVQTIDVAGKDTGSVTIGSGASAGSWQVTGTWGTSSVNQSQITTLSRGTLDTNGQTCNWGKFDFSSANNKTITLGASAINLYGTNATNRVWNGANSGVTLNPGTSLITLKTALNGGLGAFTPVGLTYYDITVEAGGSNMDMGGGTICRNMTITGSANKTDVLNISGNLTCSGVFTVNGNSAINRVLVKSSTIATQRTITAATVTVTNVDFRDIIGAGSGSWNISAVTGGAGDSGGNTNITFTTPVSRYWVGNGGSWSNTARWSASDGGASGASVPLCHDDIFFTSNSITSGSQTITLDMPRVKSLDFSSVANTPLAALTTPIDIHGNLTYRSAMTSTGSSTNLFQFVNRSDAVITSNGIPATTVAVTIQTPPGVAVSLADDWTCSNGAGNFIINSGTFNSNSHNMQVNIFQTGIVANRSITLDTSIITVTATGAGAPVNFTSSSGLTLSASSSTFVISRASSSTRIFAGSGQTFGTLTYTVAGSTGILQITGANTFGTINFSDATNARTLQFTAGTTNIILNHFNVQGTSGKLMTVNSITGGSTFTLSRSSGTESCDYLSLQDSIATGGAAWYAGTHSTNVSNNSGWIFTAGASSTTLTDSITPTETLKRDTGKFLTTTLSLTETLKRDTMRNLSDSISPAEILTKSLARTLSDIIYPIDSTRRVMPDDWVEYGGNSWSYINETAIPTVSNYADPTNTIYEAGSPSQERTVQASILFSALAFNTDDRIGIAVLVRASDGTGFNFVLRNGNVQFLNDGIEFQGGGVSISPQIGETWIFKANYNGAGVFSGKVWKQGNSEPGYQTSWSRTPDANMIYSGFLSSPRPGGFSGTFSNFICSTQELRLQLSVGKAYAESVSLSESLLKNVTKFITESLSLSETITKITNYFKTITESITLSETLTKQTVRFITESVSLTESLIKSVTKSFTESVSFIESILNIKNPYNYRSIKVAYTFTKVKVTSIIDRIKVRVDL